MRRTQPDSLLAMTQSFFLNYLQSTRGASNHTMRAYRDGLKLFFLFLSGQKRKSIEDLDLDDIQAETVLSFLNHIESKRSNSAVTRNCRLAAVRSFVQHLLRQDITRAGQYGRILAIQTKRAAHRPVAYLEPEEVRAVIATVDASSPPGRRDHALLLFLYNTGARVSEALAVRSSDRSIAHDRCGFGVRGEKSESARFGPRRLRHCVVSFALKAVTKSFSKTDKARRSPETA